MNGLRSSPHGLCPFLGKGETVSGTKENHRGGEKPKQSLLWTSMILGHGESRKAEM